MVCHLRLLTVWFRLTLPKVHLQRWNSYVIMQARVGFSWMQRTPYSRSFNIYKLIDSPSLTWAKLFLWFLLCPFSVEKSWVL